MRDGGRAVSETYGLPSAASTPGRQMITRRLRRGPQASPRPSEPTEAAPSGGFAVLRHRDYRVLWSSGLLSTTVFMMSFMLMPALAYDITGSNASAGIATMGSGFGMFLIAPIGGVIADRVRKRPLVFFGQAIPAAIILAIGVLVVTDAISIVMLTLGTLIMGFGFAFMGPARQAWIGELVPRRLVANAIAMQQVGQTMSQMIGPLLIAVLVAGLVGIGGAYLFMASLFVIVLPLTASLPDTKPAADPAGRRSIRVELSAGARYVFGDPQLRLLWAAFMALIVCGFAFQTLLPGFLDRVLDRDPTDIGPMLLVFAIAGLIANVLVVRIVGTPRMWPGMLLLGAVMAGGFALLAAAPGYGLALAAGVPLGAGRSGFMLLNQTLLISNAKPEFYGRVASTTMMAFGTQSLLAPVWGALADSIGMRPTLFIVGGAAVVALFATWLGWQRTGRSAQAAPAPSHAQ